MSSPLDAKLNLPPDKYSHGLREVLVEEVIQGSFDGAVGHLARSGGERMAKRQAEEVAVHVSQGVDAFYDQPPAPSEAADLEDSILVISADGKGIVMHPNGLREAIRDCKTARFGAGMRQTWIGSTQRRDRLFLISAFATVLLTLLGAAGEGIGHDRSQPVVVLGHHEIEGAGEVGWLPPANRPRWPGS